MNKKQIAEDKKTTVLHSILSQYAHEKANGGLRILSKDLLLLEGVRFVLLSVEGVQDSDISLGLKSRSTLNFKRKDGTVRSYKPEPVYALNIKKKSASILTKLVFENNLEMSKSTLHALWGA